MLPPVKSSPPSQEAKNGRDPATDLEQFIIDMVGKIPETPPNRWLSPDRVTPLNTSPRRSRDSSDDEDPLTPLNSGRGVTEREPLEKVIPKEEVRRVVRKLNFLSVSAPSTPPYLPESGKKKETPEDPDFCSTIQPHDFLLEEEVSNHSCMTEEEGNVFDQAFCMSDEEETFVKRSSSIPQEIPKPVPLSDEEESSSEECSPLQEELLSCSVPSRPVAPIHHRHRTSSCADPIGTSRGSCGRKYGSSMPS